MESKEERKKKKEEDPSLRRHQEQHDIQRLLSEKIDRIREGKKSRKEKAIQEQNKWRKLILFLRYLLCTYYVLNCVLRILNTSLNKVDKDPCPHGIYIMAGRCRQ